jgi:hypothetical protein
MEQERISRRDAIKKDCVRGAIDSNIDRQAGVCRVRFTAAKRASGSQQQNGGSGGRGHGDKDGLYWIEYLFPWNW